MEKSLLIKPVKGETRSVEQLRADYELEKGLAARLREASREERRVLYSSLYDEYFEGASKAPQLVRKSSPELTAKDVRRQMRFLYRFLKTETIFLEIGSGDCEVSKEVSKHVKHAFALDVSTNISDGLQLPSNCERIISDGSSIPVPAKSINLVYSNQLMEHIHPDDASDQLQNIYDALSPGGRYICITPNRFSGPHDISKYFDTVASGFHLKEYSVLELVEMFRKVGFSRCDSYVGLRGRYAKIPIYLQRTVEVLMKRLPNPIRIRITRTRFGILLGLRLVGTK